MWFSYLSVILKLFTCSFLCKIQPHNQMVYVQLFQVASHQTYLGHKECLGWCEKAVLLLKFKPTIKYVMCNYKSSSQLLMAVWYPYESSINHKIFGRPEKAHNIENNSYHMEWCVSMSHRISFLSTVDPRLSNHLCTSRFSKTFG